MNFQIQCILTQTISDGLGIFNAFPHYFNDKTPYLLKDLYINQ